MENLEEKLKELHDKVHRGTYRAHPARRTYIPKADGSQRRKAVEGGKPIELQKRMGDAPWPGFETLQRGQRKLVEKLSGWRQATCSGEFSN
jgi:hypothetical protein